MERIELDGNDYLTAKKLNKSDDQYFEKFSKISWECIDADAGVYALKKTFPSRVNYYFFSEKLRKDHLRSCLRQAERLLAEARAIQDSLDRGRRLPKRFCINNPLVDVKYDYQTKADRPAGGGGAPPPPRRGHQRTRRLLLPHLQ